ncbi:MAG: hypothetical protein QOD38_1403, partial [Acidimicrobiaceae bacterium]
MSSVQCSARPGELIEYTRAAGDVIWQLRAALVAFDAAIEDYLFASGGLVLGWVRELFYRDPIWNALVELDEVSSWVGHVGWAFAMAGGGSISSTDVITTTSLAVGSWLDPIEWKPADHVRSGQAGDWLRA